ncbi:endonuclease/exonuclease/phosphatase family protein [Aestuariivivens marinum]|uniref:endonuclease/exonuclease/phosphatase family protein n=1 Tax=Aestuariivivens marinum TaxID=2913555 RepID=UPI001F577F37|nr:endonuclease/exonuclease/phosphatase family protein [Aestuariivivens marinum]
MKKILIIALTMLFTGFVFGQNYKIMTYNIRYDNPNDGENNWSNRKAPISNQILSNKPDIIGIQEGLHHQIVYLDSILVNYKYVGVGRDDGKIKGEYSAIFYNSNTFKVIKTETFWLSETPKKISVGWDAAMERICTYALFKNKTNKERFWVFNTHFDHIGSIAREQSSILVAETIQHLNKHNYPVIITGDFNLKPESKPIKYLSNIFNDSKLTCSTLPVGPKGTFNGFDFTRPINDRIDYIFTSKSIKVKRYIVLSDMKDDKYPSDHLPVCIELLL